MGMTDPIADLLTRVRNAIGARQTSCEIPASLEKESILKILKQEGFIRDFVRKQMPVQDTLVVFPKYLGRNQKSVVNTMRRVSKPGRRVYKRHDELKPVLGGLGVSIVSTPGGIMTDKLAREKKLGGELLCEVW